MPVIAILGFAILLIPIVFVFAQYNGLVGLRNHIENAWSNIDTELKRRHELIPNLVATVKGYAKHEQEVLQQVTEMRNQCANLHGEVASHASAESQLVGALQRLMVVVESYPALKADQNYLELQRELINTEDRIQAARRFYNGNVRDYKTKCEMFPSNMVAAMFGFKPHEYFNVEPSVREVPDIEFSDG